MNYYSENAILTAVQHERGPRKLKFSSPLFHKKINISPFNKNSRFNNYYKYKNTFNCLSNSFKNFIESKYGNKRRRNLIYDKNINFNIQNSFDKKVYNNYTINFNNLLFKENFANLNRNVGNNELNKKVSINQSPNFEKVAFDKIENSFEEKIFSLKNSFQNSIANFPKFCNSQNQLQNTKGKFQDSFLPEDSQIDCRKSVNNIAEQFESTFLKFLPFSAQESANNSHPKQDSRFNTPLKCHQNNRHDTAMKEDDCHWKSEQEMMQKQKYSLLQNFQKVLEHPNSFKLPLNFHHLPFYYSYLFFNLFKLQCFEKHNYFYPNQMSLLSVSQKAPVRFVAPSLAHSQFPKSAFPAEKPIITNNNNGTFNDELNLNAKKHKRTNFHKLAYSLIEENENDTNFN